MEQSKQERILKLIDEYTSDKTLDLSQNDVIRLKQKYINDEREYEVVARELLVLKINALKNGFRINALKIMLNHKHLKPALTTMQLDHIILAFIKSGMDYTTFEGVLRNANTPDEVIAYIDSLNDETISEPVQHIPPRTLLGIANNYHMQSIENGNLIDRAVILEKLGPAGNNITEVNKVLIRDVNGNPIEQAYLKTDSLQIILDNEIIVSLFGEAMQVPVAKSARITGEKLDAKVNGIISIDIAKADEEVILLVDVFDLVKEHLAPKDLEMLTFKSHHQNGEKPFEVIKSVIRMINLLPDIQERDKKACRSQLLEAILFDLITNQSDRNWFNMAVVYNKRTKRYRLGELFDNGILSDKAMRGRIPLIGHDHQFKRFDILKQLYKYYYEDIQYLSSRMVDNKNLYLETIATIIDNNTDPSNADELKTLIGNNLEQAIMLDEYYREQYVASCIMEHLTTGKPKSIDYVAIRKARETEITSMQECRYLMGVYEKNKGRVRCMPKN